MDVEEKTITGFTSQQVCDASGLNTYQITQLRKKHIVNPHKTEKFKFRYDFQDLVVCRDIGRLVRDGTSFSKVTASYIVVMNTAEGKFQHASAIKLIQNSGLTGGDILVLSEEGLVDPESGERAFDFNDLMQPMRSRRVHTLESIQRVQRICAESDDSNDWYEYALDCEDDENISEATRAYEVCVGYDEDNADAWVNLGRLHFLAGFHMDSRVCYERALAIDENHPIANYNLGIVFEMFEANEVAIKHFERAESIPESLQNLARIYQKMGNAKRSRSYLERFLESGLK